MEDAGLAEAKPEAKVETKVLEVFDPPLYDKSKERVAKSHSKAVPRTNQLGMRMCG